MIQSISCVDLSKFKMLTINYRYFQAPGPCLVLTWSYHDLFEIDLDIETFRVHLEISS